MIRNRDVIFHKHQTLADFEKPTQPSVSSASNLTSVPSTSQSATDGGEVHDEPVIHLPEFEYDDDMPNIEGVEQGEQPPPPEI